METTKAEIKTKKKERKEKKESKERIKMKKYLTAVRKSG